MKLLGQAAMACSLYEAAPVSCVSQANFHVLELSYVVLRRIRVCCYSGIGKSPRNGTSAIGPTIRLPSVQRIRIKYRPMSLPTVIYEDDTLVAFDKPSGLLVAPDRWDKKRANLMAI